jgi:transketolase
MLAVIISSIVGAFIGTSVITISTWHRINAAEEKERDSAKWQYLLDQQDKKDPQGGAKFNRTIEQEMKNQNSDRESPSK